MKLLLIVLVIAGIAMASVAVWAQWPRASLPATTRADRVVVRKSARVLELYSGAQLLRQYHVSLGGNPIGHKQREGDSRTPEGQYTLDYRKADSAFHRALHISYPAPADLASAAKNGVAPGGFIMVHGIRNGLGWIGRLHSLRDWTDGCVAVTDRDIEEIWRAVPDHTPIRIEP